MCRASDVLIRSGSVSIAIKWQLRLFTSHAHAELGRLACMCALSGAQTPTVLLPRQLTGLVEQLERCSAVVPDGARGASTCAAFEDVPTVLQTSPPAGRRFRSVSRCARVTVCDTPRLSDQWFCYPTPYR